MKLKKEAVLIGQPLFSTNLLLLKELTTNNVSFINLFLIRRTNLFISRELHDNPD